MSRLTVALFFGGCSAEHEVSRNSAYTVAQGLLENYDLFPIGIAKNGKWYGPIPLAAIPAFTPEKFKENEVTLLADPTTQGTIYALPDLKPLGKAAVFFPVLHGSFGEDGTLQGFFELTRIPYVGAGVLASAVGMDKVIMKNVFAQAGLPQVPYLSFLAKEIEKDKQTVLEKIKTELGYPCFVKPANLGSSVGISKVFKQAELKTAFNKALQYDRKIIVEKSFAVREFEISLLGNEEPLVSLPGEIIPSNEFYDYEAKYIDHNSQLHIPAVLEGKQIETIQALALKAFKAIDCSGLARIDFFLTKDTQEIFINEINTLPGFTAISMFPKLWEYAGISLSELTSRLIQLALERNQEKSKLQLD